jgi:hypothetical protein
MADLHCTERLLPYSTLSAACGSKVEWAYERVSILTGLDRELLPESTAREWETGLGSRDIWRKTRDTAG